MSIDNRTANNTDDKATPNDERENLPGPSEDGDTGASGSTDERSSENRREGLEKDQERRQD